jgi:hypothetical protein
MKSKLKNHKLILEFPLSKLTFKIEIYLQIFRFQNKKIIYFTLWVTSKQLQKNIKALLISKILGVLYNSFLSLKTFQL